METGIYLLLILTSIFDILYSIFYILYSMLFTNPFVNYINNGLHQSQFT